MFSKQIIRIFFSQRGATFIAAIVSSTLVALILTESVVRIFNIGPDIYAASFSNYRLSENQKLRYELIPNNHVGIEFVSDQGLRDRHYSKVKPEKTFRIAILGDSITYGLFVSQNQNYVKILEKILNETFSGPIKYEVINFGVTGYDVGQIVESLASKALSFNPDLIIYGYCLNDAQLYDNIHEALLASLERSQGKFTEAALTPKKLIQRSRLFLLIRYLLTEDSKSKRINSNRWTRNAFNKDPLIRAMRRGTHEGFFQQLYGSEGAWRRLSSVLERLDELNVKLHLAIFPTLDKLDNYQLLPIHVKVKDSFESKGHYVFDLFETYIRYTDLINKNLSADILHPNLAGHTLTAAALAKYLVEGEHLPNLKKSDVEKIKPLKGIQQLEIDKVL